MKKANTVFKKFRGFFLAFFLVALAFLAVGLGTLGSFYSAGAAYELEVRHENDRNQPAVIFFVPSAYKVVDVYIDVAIIYAEAGTPAQITLSRSTSNPSPFSTSKLTWSATKFSATLENFYTPEPELGEDGKPVSEVKKPDVTDVFYRFIAPFSSSSSWSSTSSYRHWGLSATGSANILLNEVVFIGENGDGERVVIPNVEVRYAAYGEDEKPEEARLRAEALLDAQPKSVPSLEPTAFSRFTETETATLMTISEMNRGNVYATDEDPETPASADVYHADRVYGALGTDLVALGTAIFGMSPFGLRFFPMLAAFGALAVLSRFAARLFRSEKAGFIFALLFAAAGITLSLAHVGTPLMIGVFFFACALDLVHRFYAKGMKNASLLSVLPLLAAGLFGAAAICVNGAFIIPMAGVAALFAFALLRMKKAKEYQLEKIVGEAEEGDMPVPAPVPEHAEAGDAPAFETHERRAAKVISEHRFKRTASSLFFAAGLVVGAFLLSLIGMLPAYYAYLKLYDNPASPSLNVFALAWRTFANGFVGSNAYAGDTTWNFFYTLFRSEASFAAPAGTTFSVLGFCVNWVAVIAAVAGIVYAVARCILLITKKADAKTVRVTLRRTLIPLVGLCLALIAAACVRTGLVFVLLAWLFAFVLAAGLFGGTYEGRCAKVMKAVNIAGAVLLVGVFGLLLVFTLGIPLPANILAKIFG